MEICKLEIKNLLMEYNCRLVSADEWSEVLLYDEDTTLYIGDLNNANNWR